MRNVLVTGGSRGLGWRSPGSWSATAFGFSRWREKIPKGWRRRSPRRRRASLHFVPFDLSQTRAIPGLIRDMKAAHGPLYGLVNNAALGSEGLLSNMHNSEIEA